ncbi:MAG TPA: prephenate dehydrogenase/arogenate dehydrogenase family protein [Fibrobacteria bacterium]|nr:prephenate dehydrogenase/arogenate dehydrogenase family protein [Fibrobacteria bacterium]HOX51582.1 prephenate dehydrogenase/arogenate dehydrogenase family protein [Fibrobacteria bacterium]
MSLPRRLVVVGAGLLGGSLLAALQLRRSETRLVAVSSDRTLKGLEARDWCDELFGYDRLEDACEQADLVLLCSPLSSIHAHLERLSVARGRLAPNAIVMDVGSTKMRVCQAGFAGFPPESDTCARFVGGHPMAGSEKSGLGAADPLLYQSALWVLCPPPGFDATRLDSVRSLLGAVGARGAVMDPRHHDETVARVSHVPQILSSVLSGWVGSEERLSQGSLALAAGGFRDMTRLAQSSWDVWRDILATNPKPIARGLREVALRVEALAKRAHAWSQVESKIAKSGDPERMRKYLEGGHTQSMVEGLSEGPEPPVPLLEKAEEAFREAFAEGKEFRQKFRMPRKGIAHDLTEFVVRLEDRPGQLLALLEPLAKAGVNVQDLEILKVREGESGTVLMGFASSDEAQRAKDVLSSLFLVMDK